MIEAIKFKSIIIFQVPFIPTQNHFNLQTSSLQKNSAAIETKYQLLNSITNNHILLSV